MKKTQNFVCFSPDADVEEGGSTGGRKATKASFKGMMDTFGFKYVISTLRESISATHNGWKAMIYDGKEFYVSKRYDIDPIIDRVGGGDSFLRRYHSWSADDEDPRRSVGVCRSGFGFEAHDSGRLQHGFR